MIEPENVYATIRRAYRYVTAYERRMLDSTAVVDEALRGRAFEREKYSPLHTHFPSKSSVLDKWDWDNVSNYARRFAWLFGDENATGSRWILVDHVAYTAFEKRRISSGGEPGPLADDLIAVESSRSILRWMLVSVSLPPEEEVAWIIDNMYRSERHLWLRQQYDGGAMLPPRSGLTPAATGTDLDASETRVVSRLRQRVTVLATALASIDERTCPYNPFRRPRW